MELSNINYVVLYCIVFVNGSRYNKGKVTELYSKEFSPSVAKKRVGMGSASECSSARAVLSAAGQN